MHCFRRRLEVQSANVRATASRSQMEMLAGDSSGSAVVRHSEDSEDDNLARKDKLWECRCRSCWTSAHQTSAETLGQRYDPFRFRFHPNAK